MLTQVWAYPTVRIKKQYQMAGNSYGTLFKLTTFGESHGEALGGIIDGCPAGIEIIFLLIWSC